MSSERLELEDLEKRTRFQVNRVDASSAKNNGELEKLCEDDERIEVRSRQGTMDQDDGRPTSDANTYAYAKSFRQLTREALPRLDNYRNIMSIQAAYRPTLDELHNATLTAKQSAGATLKGAVPPIAGEGVVKFGWIVGVLIRCLLNIWGVMLFLRLTWVVGEAGIAQGILLVLAATVVTVITALSMSAISTNGEIKGGGTYYMISRSLGPEFGGSIGLIFSLANAIACAMYVVGFCESLRDLLKSFDAQIVDGATQDVRIVGCVTMLFLTGIVVIGMEWEAKAQFVLLMILLLAIGDFFIGAFIGPLTDEDKARGFVGLSASTFSNNLGPDYRVQKGEQHNFFSVFAIFFPAATGILAGANISGDLKDPQTAIPKGTILSIIITSIVYILMAIVAGAVVVRDASGDLADLLNDTFTDCSNRTCQYGLQNNFQVVEMVSIFGPLIYAGCFAATLSSALASLVSAPKVFQALCKDRLYPYIFWFSKGYGKNQEPVRGYVLTFFIAIVFILIGELDAIAPLISNFFLAAYALINFSTFHASLAKPVGWRPTFKFYSMWLSLVGAILCVAVMFLISWSTALVTFGIVLALYLIVQYRKPDVNWGSTTQAQTYKNALNSVQQLNYVEDHVKNYRPQILILSGIPNYRPPLIDFAFLMTKNLSLLICGHIVKSSVPQRVRNALTYKAHSWLKAHKIRAFYSQVDDSSFEEGAKSLIQASGVGKLRPNILLMGFKNDWRTCDSEDLLMYFNTMHKALDLHMAVAVLRVEGGLDYSKILSEGEEPRQNGNIPQVPSSIGIGTNGNLNRTRQNSQESLSIPHNQSFSQLSTASSVSDGDLSTPPTPNLNKSRVSESPNADDTDQTTTPEHEERSKKDRKKRDSRADLYKGAGDTDLPKDVLNSITRFQRKQKKGTIDVWWLYDDGGLTLLLPYIITTRGNWSDCKLRVFTLANKQAELEYEQRSMASLLAKFRIDYSALKLITDITKKPKDSTMSFFEDLISPFKVPESEEDPEISNAITEADLLAMKDKTNRHLRLRELLLENSSDANLVVMTLPMPRKNVVSASLYMAWLEVLTKDMPPFLLVRGNQTSVLTFYS